MLPELMVSIRTAAVNLVRDTTTTLLVFFNVLLKKLGESRWGELGATSTHSSLIMWTHC